MYFTSWRHLRFGLWSTALWCLEVLSMRLWAWCADYETDVLAMRLTYANSRTDMLAVRLTYANYRTDMLAMRLVSDLLTMRLTCWLSDWHANYETDMLAIRLTCWLWDMLAIRLTCWLWDWHAGYETNMLAMKCCMYHLFVITILPYFFQFARPAWLCGSGQLPDTCKWAGDSERAWE